MLLTPEDIILKIDTLIQELSSHNNSVSNARIVALNRLRSHVFEKGFSTEEQYLSLSLIPLIFQEANYDEISWTDQKEALDRLEPFFTIDVANWSHGKTRAELSPAEHEAYVSQAFKAIKFRLRK